MNHRMGDDKFKENVPIAPSPERFFDETKGYYEDLDILDDKDDECGCDNG